MGDIDGRQRGIDFVIQGQLCGGLLDELRHGFGFVADRFVGVEGLHQKALIGGDCEVSGCAIEGNERIFDGSGTFDGQDRVDLFLLGLDV